MHFFTGTHKDYHRPSDDYDKLNVAGMRRVGQMVAEIALTLAEAPQRPVYQETENPHGAGGGGGGDRPYFGSIPDFTQDQPGYALTGVTKGSPAEKGGLQGGDIIIGLGESKIGNLEDFDSALRKYKAGDRVPVTVKRGGKEQKFEVTLEPPR
jgi:S1-C subfamily serine protease